MYVDDRSARVVHLMADADNASIGFTAPRRERAHRDPELGRAGRPDQCRRAHAPVRAPAHPPPTPVLHLGWFLLGTMRVERDFQYEQRAAGAFANAPYRVSDLDAMLTAMATLDAPTRTRHLQQLRATSLDAVRERLYPRPTLRSVGAQWVATVRQVTLDARDTLTPRSARRTAATWKRAWPAIRSRCAAARAGRTVSIDVHIATTARALSPLSRTDIFTDDFLRFPCAKRVHAVPQAARVTRRSPRVEWSDRWWAWSCWCPARN